MASTRAARIAALPPGLPPRGLARAEAAAYIGVGVTLFDVMVADGRMPSPKTIGSRRIWDRLALDSAFAALPDGDGHADTDSKWGNVAC